MGFSFIKADKQSATLRAKIEDEGLAQSLLN